jgi:hypothetical protein
MSRWRSSKNRVPHHWLLSQWSFVCFPRFSVLKAFLACLYRHPEITNSNIIVMPDRRKLSE